MNKNITTMIEPYRCNRAGVIPYTIYNGRIFFLFGIHFNSSDICDFGGGRKKDETSKDTAIREFKEETNSLFGDIYQYSMFRRTTSILCRRRQNMIFFLPVDKRWLYQAPVEFKSRNEDRPNKEILKVVWVDQDKYKSLIYGSKISLDGEKY